MPEENFEWDEEKNLNNQRKHGVSGYLMNTLRIRKELTRLIIRTRNKVLASFGGHYALKMVNVLKLQVLR